MSFLTHWWGQLLVLATAIGLAKPLLDAWGVLETLGTQLNRLRRFFQRSRHGVPSSTLVVITQPMPNALYWGMARANDKPVMSIGAAFYVTNKLDRSIRLAGALLKVNRFWFFTRELRAPAHVKDMYSQYSPDNPIRPHQRAEVTVHFMPVFNPFREEPESFNARVAIIDQYDNKHWVLCKFKHRSKLHE